MRWAPVVVVAALMAGETLTGQELRTPADWKWIPDTPARVIDAGDAGPDAMFFVAMPPGWHITQGPGALLYQPDYQARGSFVVEAEVFVFPSSSLEEYGIFLGGRSLEPAAANRTYLAFVARRDGQAAVLERTSTGIVPVANWMTNTGVAPKAGTDPIKNVLRVDVGAIEVVFSANGTSIAKLPRARLSTDGQFGLRIGKGVNVHVSRLDVTHRLAPAKGGP
jgi:hypothetical protein